MNAYELAYKLYEDLQWIVTSNTDLPSRLASAINMLRQQADRIDKLEREAIAKNNYLEQHCQKIDQQADRIAELEQAIKDADEWLESGEGVSLCYYAFSTANPKSIKIIKEITG